MPSFSYKAFDETGKETTGFINADSERLARKLIKKLNLVPIRVWEVKSTKEKIKVKNSDLVVATRQISSLLEASTQIDDALKITADQLNSKNMKSVLYSLKEEIVQGKRLGDAMKKFPKVFSNTYISLIKAGDTSGNLAKMFNSLANYLEDSMSIKQKIRSALIYPFILFTFSIIVIIALLTFVMPQVVGQFVKSGADLPFLTSALLTISNFLPYIIITFILLIIFGSFFFKSILSTNRNALIRLHKFFLSLPFLGTFLLKSETEKFSSTMHLLTSSGLVLDDALQECSKVLTNAYLRSELLQITKSIKEGSDFGLLLTQKQIFPEIFSQLIASGYRSGNLTDMFHKSSIFLRNDIETSRSTFLSLIEPIIIILMGGFILLIVMAILVPIMQMNTLILG